MNIVRKIRILLLFIILTLPSLVYVQDLDWRNIDNGDIIPDEAYSDQPYIVKTDDGAWLCVMTTGSGHEGATGQHIITLRSTDKGKTWIDKQDVEPSDGPEASYAVLLKAPSGRVFVFYNHNTDNIRSIQGNNPPYKNGKVKRVDSQGYFVFKYSDDHGKTWSNDRYTIPVRAFEIDKNNVYEGKIRFFWNVGKAFANKGIAYVPLIKVGGFGEGFFTTNEGALLASPNLFTVKNPGEAKWNTLPDGEIGLRTPPGGGPIAGEQSYTILSDGAFYCVYRTIDGFPVYTYSRDQGHNWDEPKYMTYANARKVKHPRAANFVWKCENGKYLYWYHNHGGDYIGNHPNNRSMGYNDRNPVWVMGGIETNGPNGKVIKWTQPEILLYTDDPIVRMSYPDLIEEDGEYYISETQKDIARVHHIDKKLLEKLWQQLDNPGPADNSGVVLNWNRKNVNSTIELESPNFPEFYVRDRNRLDGGGKSTRNGFTIEFNFLLKEIIPGEVVLSTIDEWGRGWSVKVNNDKNLELLMSDGRSVSIWECDDNQIIKGKKQHVSIIVDGGPRVISYVIDGLLNDGGTTRQFGWGRFNPYIQSVDGNDKIKVGSSVSNLRIYDRAITTTESIGNFQTQK